MSKDPAFLFYPGDYLKDTQCLSESAQTAYDRIMCEHMRNICISQERLNFFIKRLNDEQKSEVMHVLTKVSGGFQIEWVADSILKRRNYSDSRRKNREGKGKSNPKDVLTYVSHMENANEIGSEDEILITYKDWTQKVLEENDAEFQTMLFNERATIKLSGVVFDALTRDHLGLLSRYPKMRPQTQQAFRESLMKHIRENKDKANGNTTGNVQKNSTGGKTFSGHYEKTL